MIKNRIWKEFKSYLFITLGLGLGTFGWSAFIIPSEIVGGGLTGIATLLYYSFGWDLGITSLVINIVLISLATKIIGSSFGIKTIYCVIVFSGFLSLYSNLIHEPLVSEKMMAALTGAILAGTGSGLVFTQGGSTGGSDIIALIINKYRNFSLGRLLLSIDAIIISCSFPIFRSIETLVYGFMTMAVIAYTVDMVISGTKQTVQFFIFSKKHEELAHHIIHVANRGLTIIPAIGGYTNEEVKVLMVIARKSESAILFRIIKDIDHDAFITMGNVMGVYGNGFDKLNRKA